MDNVRESCCHCCNKEEDRRGRAKEAALPMVEIDATAPFSSVKEAVAHFERTGLFRPPRWEIDPRSAEERALELEKDLIVKELEALDVLEELGSAKRIVEELKRRVRREAQESPGGDDRDRMRSWGLTILTELDRARSTLGKAVGELGAIRSYVELVRERIGREREILERALPLVSASPLKLRPQPDIDGATVAEMKLVAARKMEEAARAAEAVAMAEIEALSRNEASFSIFLPGPDDRRMISPTGTPRWDLDEAPTRNNRGGRGRRDGSRSEILEKLEDATEEVKLSQRALEEARGRVEVASRKQVAAGEALRRWMTKRGGDNSKRASYPAGPIFPSGHPVRSPNDDRPKPVLRTTVSMRDVLGRKLVLPEEYVVRRPTEGGCGRVALSQMLSELREDLTRPDGAGRDQRKQFAAPQRKRFGFMHITLPLTKQVRKDASAAANLR